MRDYQSSESGTSSANIQNASFGLAIYLASVLMLAHEWIAGANLLSLVSICRAGLVISDS